MRKEEEFFECPPVLFREGRPSVCPRLRGFRLRGLGRVGGGLARLDSPRNDAHRIQVDPLPPAPHHELPSISVRTCSAPLVEVCA